MMVEEGDGGRMVLLEGGGHRDAGAGAREVEEMGGHLQPSSLSHEVFYASRQVPVALGLSN